MVCVKAVAAATLLGSATTTAFVTPRNKVFGTTRRLMAAPAPSETANSGSFVDMDRARECTEHWDECTVDEMEEMRSALQAERIKEAATHMAATEEGALDPYMVRFMTTAAVDMADPQAKHQRLLLEEDLEQQLSLLKDVEQSVSSSLFPETYSVGFDLDLGVKSPTPSLVAADNVSPEVSTTTDSMAFSHWLESEELAVEDALMAIAAFALILWAPHLF